jgi:hypothetical protein
VPTEAAEAVLVPVPAPVQAAGVPDVAKRTPFSPKVRKKQHNFALTLDFFGRLVYNNKDT